MKRKFTIRTWPERYAIVEKVDKDWATKMNIREACEMNGITPSSYYFWRDRRWDEKQKAQ